MIRTLMQIRKTFKSRVSKPKSYSKHYLLQANKAHVKQNAKSCPDRAPLIMRGERRKVLATKKAHVKD
jgi:hypothetical protein